MTSKFSQDIQKFNGMYRMLTSPVPTLDIGVDLTKRLTDLKDILQDELDEIDDIIVDAELYQQAAQSTNVNEDEMFQRKLDVLTGIADLMGDLQVYCASEMAKFGLPQDEVLSIIMDSNFSKMGENGLPIYNDQGKLQKGPNYWKPEPKIRDVIISCIANSVV